MFLCVRVCKRFLWPNMCKHVPLSPRIISASVCETMFYLPLQILWSSAIWLWQADGLPSLPVTDAPLHWACAAGAQVTAGNVAHTANQPVTDMQVVLDDNPTHTDIDTQLSAVFLSLLLVREWIKTAVSQPSVLICLSIRFGWSREKKMDRQNHVPFKRMTKVWANPF